MISQQDGLAAASHSQAAVTSEGTPSLMTSQALVRYGVIPQVARYSLRQEITAAEGRGNSVVIETDRGIEIGVILEVLRDPLGDRNASGSILRVATAEDLDAFTANETVAAESFAVWNDRIATWKLDLQLVDLELSLDRERTILYVLNDRGAETTRLALLAAAAGLGIISVQPVAAEGVVFETSGGGCGSGGCGSGGCSH